jgi:glycosyltransferase involved in cell wall biosynthesis
METHTKRVVEHLIAKGWEVTVATPELSGEPCFKNNAIHYYRLGKSPSILLKYSVSFWLRVWKLLKNQGNNYDAILNISMAIGGFLPLTNKVKSKTVTIFHGTYPLERRTLIMELKEKRITPKVILGIVYTYFFQLLQYLVSRQSQRIVSVSDDITKNLGSTYGVKIAKKIMTISNFVDLSHFSHKRKGNYDKVRVLFLARIHREKGIIFLIDALSKLKQTHADDFTKIDLHIVGKGPELEQAQVLSAKYGLDGSVKFDGEVLNDRVPKILTEFDIYLFPILGKEGQPFSLIEAMAAGLVPIASDINGPRGIVEDGRSGILFEPGNEDAFIEAFLSLINNKDDVAKLGEGAIARVASNFSANVQLAKFDKILEELGHS